MSEEFEFDIDALVDNVLLEAQGEMNKKGGNKSGNLGITFLPKSGANFQMRICADAKGKLFHTWKEYKRKLALIDPDGNQVLNDKGEKQERNFRYRVPVDRDEDPNFVDKIKPYVDEIDDWHNNARYNMSFFGEITSIEAGESKFFKPGVCLLLCGNKKFLDSLNTAMATLAKKGEKGRQLLKDTLNPSGPGVLIDVQTAGQGRDATVKVTFDLLADDRHEFTPVSLLEFKDITATYCPKFGPENDVAGEKIKEFFKNLISSKSDQIEPDKVPETPASTPEPAKADGPKETPEEKPKADAGDELDDIDKQLADAGV